MPENRSILCYDRAMCWDEKSWVGKAGERGGAGPGRAYYGGLQRGLREGTYLATLPL